MADLAERECVPCRGGVPPMKGEEIEELLPQLEGWQVIDEHHLQKLYRFKDFRASLEPAVGKSPQNRFRSNDEKNFLPRADLVSAAIGRRTLRPTTEAAEARSTRHHRAGSGKTRGHQRTPRSLADHGARQEGPI